MIDFSSNKEMFKPSIKYLSVKPRVYDYLNRSAEFRYEEGVEEKEENRRQSKMDVLNRSAEIVRGKN